MLEQYILNEVISPNEVNCKVLLEAASDPSKPKTMYFQGIFVQAEIKNQNGRIYPLSEIRNAVNDINDRIKSGYSILSTSDHPVDTIETSISDVCGNIEKMWMDGNNGMGKMRILPTPVGNIVRTLLENDIKLGCSSRGTGEIGYNGVVENYQIQTVDIVTTPSGPDCYPVPVLESMRNRRYGKEITKLSHAMTEDQKAQRYLMNELNSWLTEL